MAPSASTYCLIFMVMGFTFMNMMGCSAKQHVVGDNRGWDPASDFKGWASRKIFHVRDNLWFAYASSQQSVLELKSQEEFENCDVSNPIKLYDGGLDAVPLIEMGDRYFTNGNVEDCQCGMKVHINVLSDGLDNGQSDNFNVVSDGLDNAAKDLGLYLLSDGMEHYIVALAGDDLMEEGAIKEVIAEGPTSSRRQLSDCPPSILINLTLSICGTVITMLIYAML
ncbi:early nodulin-like protein 3 [Cryptomeria japonica]|uniref:early nodulin-like protein 3 n=1 Tax=Cryptomeria japonica TaxID=3369 RepID=UPI0025ACB752|nr:early nodulin-like protein 3 [Cryptomeria japonica]